MTGSASYNNTNRFSLETKEKHSQSQHRKNKQTDIQSKQQREGERQRLLFAYRILYSTLSRRVVNRLYSILSDAKKVYTQ